LRVWVEVGISQDKDELDQTDKMWESLEQRRATSLRGPLKEEQERDERKRYPIGERLDKARRLVVLGDPGSGKTTLTRWIATAFLLRLKKDPDFKELPDVATLPDVDWLPIIVRCRDLDLTCLSGSLDDILKHTLRKAELSYAEATDLHELLRLRLKDGEALLMLDGLDEITDPAVRTCFCQQLEQIVRAFPDAPIIATSRIVGYREMGYQLGQGFEHLTLADLTPEEKDDFARRWCDLTELPERRTTATEEFIHDIHSADRIERLTGNPMLLTTMALVKRKIGKLPNRRAELYWEAVQVLLNWRREVDEPRGAHRHPGGSRSRSPPGNAGTRIRVPSSNISGIPRCTSPGGWTLP
jgi:predicted NACHT family NTPase